MDYKDLYPKEVPRDAFLPYGEDGWFFVVPGELSEDEMIDGCLAAVVDLNGWEGAAEALGYHGEVVQPWYEDDSDKPDDVYHAEVREAFRKVYRRDVSYGWARFWTEEHKKHPNNPYRDWGCGVEMYRPEIHDYSRAPVGSPSWVRVTRLVEH